MREAFGGGFMIRLVLVFIVIYTGFMAVAVNYAKVFRIKNHVINMLEQSQYRAGDDLTPINDYLSTAAYVAGDDNLAAMCRQEGDGNLRGDWAENGACIIPHCSDDGLSCSYTVKVYLMINFPLIVEHLPITIKGETKTIIVR